MKADVCNHVVAVGEGDGGRLRASELPAEIARCRARRIAWSANPHAIPALATVAREETEVQSFLHYYIVFSYCPDCGEKLPTL